jgi:hypothetical protein
MKTESKNGIWLVSMFDKKAGDWTRFIPSPDYYKGKKVHNIIAPNDCDGDVLWDYLSEQGLVDNWDEYDIEGDTEYCVAMHKTGTKPDYMLEFRAYVEKSWYSDDCHTFS